MAIEAEPIIFPEMQSTELSLVVDNEQIQPDSTNMFESYMHLRAATAEIPKPDEAATHAVQESVRNWIEQNDIAPQTDDPETYYSTYDREAVERKMGGLIGYLSENHADVVSPEEIETTRAFIDSTFAMYDSRSGDGEVHPDAEGSFAFVVPARMDRKHPEYGKESELIIPAFRYVPNELRAQLMVGLPPFIIEQYEPDAHGRRGYVVLAPVYGDMADDIAASAKPDDSFAKLITMGKGIASDRVNDAVDFAQERLGVEVVGLGAVIPGLTKYGNTVTNDKVVTTTGHGGTLEIVRGVVREHGHGPNGEAPKKIGYLGLGSIGKSAAHLGVHDYPDAEHIMFDTREQTLDSIADALAAESGANIVKATSLKDVVEQSDVFMSFIAGDTLDLRAEGVEHTDALGVDDSQPRSYDPEQLRELGGRPAEVVARDTKGIATRTGYNYGDTVAHPKFSLFGCEAEAAVLAAYYADMKERGMPAAAAKRVLAQVAIQSAVTPKSSSRIGTLFRRFGIETDALQADGKYA